MTQKSTSHIRKKFKCLSLLQNKQRQSPHEKKHPNQNPKVKEMTNWEIRFSAHHTKRELSFDPEEKSARYQLIAHEKGNTNDVALWKGTLFYS